VIGRPFPFAADQLTWIAFSWKSAESAPDALGALMVSGVPNGMTAGDGALHGDQPAAFFARTWKAYDVPFVRPVHVRLCCDAGRSRVEPPGLSCTS
jgi:hypothetical protein